MHATVNVKLSPGKGDGVLFLGMVVSQVIALLGEPNSIYPAVDEIDPEIDDSTHFLYPSIGIEIEFDQQRKKNGSIPKNAKLKSIQYQSKALRDGDGHRLTRSAIHDEFGEPNEIGQFPRKNGKLGQWEFYRMGLQADYDQSLKLLRVILCPATKE